MQNVLVRRGELLARRLALLEHERRVAEALAIAHPRLAVLRGTPSEDCRSRSSPRLGEHELRVLLALAARRPRAAHAAWLSRSPTAASSASPASARFAAAAFVAAGVAFAFSSARRRHVAGRIWLMNSGLFSHSRSRANLPQPSCKSAAASAAAAEEDGCTAGGGGGGDVRKMVATMAAPKTPSESTCCAHAGVDAHAPLPPDRRAAASPPLSFVDPGALPSTRPVPCRRSTSRILTSDGVSCSSSGARFAVRPSRRRLGQVLAAFTSHELGAELARDGRSAGWMSYRGLVG